jgi:hypothetical protein
MDRMIGNTKTWVWWLAGLACAFVFQSVAKAGQMMLRYGVRPRPRPASQPAVSAEQKKKAAKLVTEYLEGKGSAQPSAEERKQIAKLIKDLGSNEFAVREAASAGVLKFGLRALPQLEEARKSTDAEVVQRAGAAIQEIRKGGGSRVVGELRKMYAAALAAISEAQQSLRKGAYAADLQAIALDSQKKTEAARKKRAEKAALEAKVQELNKLANLVRYGATARPVLRREVRAKYGCKVILR